MLEFTYGEDKDLNSAYELMAYSEDYQDKPYVGAFWYDPIKQELYGVKPSLATDVPWYHSNQWNSDVKTGSVLHKTIWNKEVHRGRDKRFSGDYTLKPRGRVFEFKDKGFVVFTGSWINDYPEAKQEILDEFQLPEGTEFRIDSHWDLGHGWSQEF